MRLKIILLALLCFSKNYGQKIEWKERKTRLSYHYQSKQISKSDVNRIIQNKHTALELWRKANRKQLQALGLSTIGLAVAVDGFHRKSSMNQPCWNQVIAGGVLVLMGTWRSKGIKEKRKRAINYYNDEVAKTKNKPTIGFAFNKVTIRF